MEENKTVILNRTADDLAYVNSEHHKKYPLDPVVEIRQIGERAVIRAAVLQLLKAGFGLRVYDGEEFPVLDYYSDFTDMPKIMACLMSTDGDHLCVYVKATPEQLAVKPRKLWNAVGAVSLVYGNSAWEVISDYSVRLEPHLTDADKLSTAMGSYGFEVK